MQGYGENKPKSSTMAQEVKSVPGVYMNKIQCGFAHTLMIARNDSKEDQEKIERLPIYQPGGPTTTGK